MRFLIPIIAGLLFRAGGCDQWTWCPLNQKLWRWLMGIPIGLLYWEGWLDFGLTILAYLIATNLFGYGDKTPILKYLPKTWKFIVSGFMFGLASVFLLEWWAIAQALVSAVAFYFIMKLDDEGSLKNPWVEIARGFCGTIMLVK